MCLFWHQYSLGIRKYYNFCSITSTVLLNRWRLGKLNELQQPVYSGMKHQRLCSCGELSVGNNIQFCTWVKPAYYRCGTHREPLFSQRLWKPLTKARAARTTPTEGLRSCLGKDSFYEVRKASGLASLAAGFLPLHHAPRGQFPLQLLENTTSGACILFCLWTKRGGKIIPQRVTEFSENPTSFSWTNNR